MIAQQRLTLVALALLLTGSCGPCLKDAVGPPPPPPANPVEVVGNGALVSAHLGPAGGSLKLGPEGPAVEIPAGMPGPGGLSVALEQQGDEGLPPVARRIGGAFRATPTLSPPSGQWLLVRSVALDPLPPECAAPALQLAIEAATTAPGPALAWRFEHADWQQGHAVARLSELAPVRLQFVCAASGETR